MEKLMSIFEGFEGFELDKLGELLPSPESMLTGLNRWLALFVLIGPLLMLGFGIYYLFFAPKEANHSMGFRFGYAMSCVEVWQLTQRLAGIAYSALGLVLTVIIGIVSLRFGKMAPPDMVWLAAKCLIWEAVLVIVATLVVDIIIVVMFDIKGNPRSAKAKEMTKKASGSRSTRKTQARKSTRSSTSARRTPRTASKTASERQSSKSVPKTSTGRQTPKATPKTSSDKPKTAPKPAGGKYSQKNASAKKSGTTRTRK